MKGEYQNKQGINKQISHLEEFNILISLFFCFFVSYMQNNSSSYTSNLKFSDPGYRPLSLSSVSYLAQDGLIKKLSQNMNDKYRYDPLSYSRPEENIFPEPNLSKRASIDFMKKSIHPSSNLKSNSSHEEFVQKFRDDFKRYDTTFLDKTNSDSNSKPIYLRKSLNLNSLTNLQTPVKSRRSYNFPSQENILSPQLKELFLEKSRSKEKKNDRGQNQYLKKSYHKRHPSSYGYLNQTQPNVSPRRSFAMKKSQQNYSNFFFQKNMNILESKKPQNIFPVIEPLALKNDSQVDISFSSEEIISEAQTQMTARFNYSEENKNSNSLSNEQKLTTPLGKKVSQQSKKTITLQNFILGPCKGKGRYGKVYLAIQCQTGFLCALKQISLKVVKGMMGQFISELKIQLFLQSPYVTKIYGYFIQNENIYLIMEYMTDGNLYERIKKKGPIPQNRAAVKLQQICQGLKEMHHFSVIHRDLKPENIVMSFGVCKICDFSWAVKCDQRRQTNCGTLDYLSPEMISGEGYSSSIDLWAMGVLLYEMLVGKPPFYNTSIKETTKRIKQCAFTLPDSLSKQAKLLIECFLQRNPQQRKQIGEIVKHAFFRNVQQ